MTVRTPTATASDIVDKGLGLTAELAIQGHMLVWRYRDGRTLPVIAGGADDDDGDGEGVDVGIDIGDDEDEDEDVAAGDTTDATDADADTDDDDGGGGDDVAAERDPELDDTDDDSAAIKRLKARARREIARANKRAKEVQRLVRKVKDLERDQETEGQRREREAAEAAESAATSKAARATLEHALGAVGLSSASTRLLLGSIDFDGEDVDLDELREWADEKVADLRGEYADMFAAVSKNGDGDGGRPKRRRRRPATDSKADSGDKGRPKGTPQTSAEVLVSRLHRAR